MKKNLLFTAFLILLLALGYGYFMYQKPLEKLTHITADYTLSPEQLLSDFEMNEESANSTYLDKIIEVTGEVKYIHNENEKMTIYLDANNELSNVIFQLETPDPTIQLNDEVTLKGLCTGFLMDVVLVRAVKSSTL